MNRLRGASLWVLVLMLFGGGCLRVKTDPIHVTVDVNVRVQKELADFFQDIDAADPTMQP